MCYYVDSKITKKEIKDLYQAKFEGQDFLEEKEIGGFSHPKLAVILDTNPQVASSAVWGLKPSWAQDDVIQNHTLNARIETLREKPAFKDYHENRCLILIKGFYEWKWLDGHGKSKQKYYLRLPNQPVMALAGIYNSFKDQTKAQMTTFSIVTTQANELMSEIHNTKYRMPVILTNNLEKNWLNHEPLERFSFPNHEAELEAEALNSPPYIPSLF